MAPKGSDTRPILQLIFEQISASGETRVGANEFTQLPDGRSQVVQRWVMFSTSSYTPQVPGTSTATGLGSYYLWTEEAPNDGTLRNIVRTYQTAGIVATGDEILNGGRLHKKTITSFKTVPVTPTGYTLVGTPVQNPNGYPIYTYTYYSADPGSTPAGGGEISRRFVDAQGGTAAFNESSPNSSVGAVRCIITYLTPSSVTTDPTTGPTSFVRIGIDYEDRDGYRVWTVTYGFGAGLVINETTISASGALVVYHRVQFGSAPTTPTPTIGGTVTLFESSTRNADGYVVYDYRWAEGDGRASITTEGQPDGALIYTVTDYDGVAGTPAYPGSGTAYLIRLTQKPEGGFFVNTAIYKKPPATITFKKQINFTKPGNVVFTGSPPQLVYTSPVTMTLLADVEVSYATSQTTTAPFTVESYATLYFTYTPTDTGIAVPGQQALGGYLAGASSISGTNSSFNGVLCDEWSATLGSSTPSSFSTGLKTLSVDNDPYLTDTSGTIIYRRSVTTYTF